MVCCYAHNAWDLACYSFQLDILVLFSKHVSLGGGCDVGAVKAYYSKNLYSGLRFVS